jgi:fibronectin-binding autotransporter adhesin
VNGGTLEVSATTLATTQPLGATNRPLNLDGGTLSLDGGASTYSIPNYITTNATSTILVGNSTEGLNVTSTNTSIGIGVGNTTTAATLNVDLATGSTFTVNGPVGNSGVASGGGNGTIELGTSTGTFRWNNTGSTTGIGAPNVTFDLGTGTASMNSGNTQSGKISLGALEGGANTNLYGDTKVADAVTYQIGNNSLTATAIFSGNINNQAPTANTTAVTKIGPATEELLGSGNYTGITTISNGTLAVGTLSAGGSNSSIGASPNAATNLVINGGTLQYLGSGSTTDRLFTIGLGNATLDASGTGAVSFTNPGALAFATPTVSQPFSLTLAGNSTAGNVLASVIADQNTGAGNVTNVNKEGAGVWNLTGVSTYTGTTNVNAGQLILLGGTLFSTNSVNINSGGTFGGNGTVSAGVVTLGNGGTIYAGLGFGDATLTLPNLTWTGGGNIEVGAVDGVGSDNISLGGGALTSAGSGNYDVDFEGVTFDTPDDYTLISYGSETGFTASDFSAEDVNFGPGLSGSFNLTTSGAGNLTFDVIAVPEPAMEALLAGGVIFLIGFRRRRAVV